jgi:D-tyrosyl-tRNA(Tyr) deacylase
VRVDGEVAGRIARGFLVLLGVGKEDTETDADYLVEKICGLRVFEDGEGKMNVSLEDVGGALLVISQFTLYGDVRKGRRPSFDAAAPPGKAKALYEYFLQKTKERGVRVESGVFQASMSVELINEGPVTILCDSKRTF